ncbi:sugar MFS transporter [Altericroceibacterium spongiae]|uniref:Sugar MFS transporter n=1 Tax=Altericroceibacterium spongiae TaxID=2320269 RepID=A0A420EAE6_9SPHN|nr:sugar MFS transporter [Altericroceibacterium spongiae]RKF17630.1 sugar MFS transporter [Altericroceibacterium spongiae]
MALAPDGSASGPPLKDPETGESGHIDAPGLQGFVFALFFIFGGITSLNDVIIPKLKELFDLSYFQAMLVQSAFFAAYLIISIPGALLVKRIGYMRGAVVGLLAMLAGCLLFIPASQTAIYGLFLFALFVLASGVTVIQVVANPLISLLGPARTAPSRLTFAQGFNALGTTLFPYFGSIIILGSLATVSAAELSGPALDAYRAQESRAIVHAYIGLAVALAIVAAVVWRFRNHLKGEAHEASSGLGGFDLLKRPRFGFGTGAIFLYVGAEVAIGSLIVSYLMQESVLGLAEQQAGKLIPFYWGGALIGRFIGSLILRFLSPGKVLSVVACGAITLLLLAANMEGALAGYSLLAIGLMNAIMFPTIFSLASEGLGPRAADGSGVICMAIVGGAVIPPLTGGLADAAGSLALALTLPALCYVMIALFGLFALKPVKPL